MGVVAPNDERSGVNDERSQMNLVLLLALGVFTLAVGRHLLRRRAERHAAEAIDAALPEVAAIGGSWFVSPKLMAEGKWDEITRQTKEALTAIDL